jgi:predicted nucleotidyltransferase component of viral defense system
MSLFDQLVDEAIKNKQELSQLRIVVEKELLHHDILRILNQAGLLSQLTFIGGTCLRACYGSNRLSEDLDFTGGVNFSKDALVAMAHTLVHDLNDKYGLEVTVSEPSKEQGNVETWVLKVQTRPGRRDLPSQRINIDVCAIPSYEAKPMVLINPYGVEMGTSGLILKAQSREEIYTDKLVAFALRPNRIKNRDLWDIVWLHQQGVSANLSLLLPKLNDHHKDPQEFAVIFEDRCKLLKTDTRLAQDFATEMRRFLPAQLISTLEQPLFWDFLTNLMGDLQRQVQQTLDGKL